ncbi:hypothetical protein Tco_0013040 [Tanacetum coccineum]
MEYLSQSFVIVTRDSHPICRTLKNALVLTLDMIQAYHPQTERAQAEKDHSKLSRICCVAFDLLRDALSAIFGLSELKNEELYAKFSMCEFWLSKVQFLGYVIDSEGIHVDPTKIMSIKGWASPKTPTEIHQFLGLAGYYRRFIEGFSKIAKPMTKLTQKSIKFDWGVKEETSFQLLKQKLCSTPILALPERSKIFVILNAQAEAMKEENLKEENLRDMNKEFENRAGGTLCNEKQRNRLNGEAHEIVLEGSSLEAWSANINHLR